MNKTLVIVLVVVVVLVGGYLLMRGDKSSEGTASDTTGGDMSNVPPLVGDAPVGDLPAASDGEMDPGTVKEFTVEGSNFKFSVAEMRVKKGDAVKVVFKNVEGFHDWVIDEFNTKTKQLKAGEQETIEFVADKLGTFEYYCSVGEHRKMGMVGKLIVE